MNVSFTSLGTNHGQLHIKLEEKDIQPQIKDKLKKLRKNAHIKGFRQGAAPESLIQKLYGQAVEAEVIEKLLNDGIGSYQKDNNIHFLGDLLPIRDAEGDQNPENHVYNFEVGITPTFDLKQILEQTVVDKLKIQISPEMLQEELEQIKTRYGKEHDTENGVVERGDYLLLEAIELEGTTPLDGGIVSEFNVLADDTVSSEFLEAILGKSTGFEFDFEIGKIDPSMEEKSIRKYFLKLADGDNRAYNAQFRFRIKSLKRYHKAEIGEELFKNLYGPQEEYNSVEDFENRIQDGMVKYYDVECEKILEIDLNKALFKNMALPFPDDFLKKWLRSSFEEWANKKPSTFDHDLYHFKEGLTWQLIRDQITAEQNIRPSVDEVVNSWINQMRSSYPGLDFPMAQWYEFAARALKDEAKYRQALLGVVNDRCFEWLKTQVQVQEKPVSIEEFREKVKSINSHADHFHGEEDEDHHAHQH